jgi:hypothetical protein
LCISAGDCREKPLAAQQKTAAKSRPDALSIGKHWTFPGLPIPLVDNFVNKELETYRNLSVAPFLQSASPREEG